MAVGGSKREGHQGKGQRAAHGCTWRAGWHGLCGHVLRTWGHTLHTGLCRVNCQQHLTPVAAEHALLTQELVQLLQLAVLHLHLRHILDGVVDDGQLVCLRLCTRLDELSELGEPVARNRTMSRLKSRVCIPTRERCQRCSRKGELHRVHSQQEVACKIEAVPSFSSCMSQRRKGVMAPAKEQAVACELVAQMSTNRCNLTAT
jgi:hypothetical protein